MKQLCPVRYGGGTASMQGDPETPPHGEVSVSCDREVRVDLSQPWLPVQHAAPIPTTLEQIHLLSGPAFDELVATNLVARQDVPGWNRLWKFLADDDTAREATYDVLERLLEITDEALNARALSAKDFPRARKLRDQLDRAWKRLDSDPDHQPLAWAGSAAAGFNPASKRVIARLVEAIDQHRADTPDPDATDQDLYAVLGQLGLDPSRTL